MSGGVPLFAAHGLEAFSDDLPDLPRRDSLGAALHAVEHVAETITHRDPANVLRFGVEAKGFA